MVGHSCGAHRQALRAKPAVAQPNQPKMVWQPKKRVQQLENQQQEVIDATEENDKQNEDATVLKITTPVFDGQVVQNPVSHEEGWRIVSRRKKVPKSPSNMIGLAQVQAVTRGFSFDGGGEEEEEVSNLS